jgi:type II secretory pathway pseudopilin PulG
MAALLVGMSIMAILMGAALPVWNKQAQREREEEYLFRAHQYARAVMKFRQRIANTNPPSVDVLVEQRFLRRKYKDPITGEDFQLVYQTAAAGIQPGGGTAQPGQIGQPGGSGGTGGFGRPGSGGASGGGGNGGFGSLGGSPGQTGTSTMGAGGTATTSTGGTPTAGTGAPIPGAGIIGVVSKSKGTSIKIYNGRTRYDQWAVTYQDVRPGKGLPPDLLQALNAAGAAAAGAGALPAGQNPFGGGGAARPGANPFAAPGGQNPFGAPGGQNPFGAPGGQNPFGGGGFGQPMQPGGAQPPAGASGSPFNPAYPPPPGAGAGGTLFGPPPKKGN